MSATVCERCLGAGTIRFHPNDVPKGFLIFGGRALLDSEGRHRMVCPHCRPSESRAPQQEAPKP